MRSLLHVIGFTGFLFFRYRFIVIVIVGTYAPSLARMMYDDLFRFFIYDDDEDDVIVVVLAMYKITIRNICEKISAESTTIPSRAG